MSAKLGDILMMNALTVGLYEHLPLSHGNFSPCYTKLAFSFTFMATDEFNLCMTNLYIYVYVFRPIHGVFNDALSIHPRMA